MCDVHILANEPSAASDTISMSRVEAARAKLKRASEVLADAVATLSALEEQPFPWKEAKNDDGTTYFYDENSDEAVLKLPAEDAVIYFEKKRLQKVIQSAKKVIEASRKLLGNSSEDEAAAAAQSVNSKPTAKSSSSKLPLHLQKARNKAKRSGASQLVDTESASEDAKDSEDVIYVQKVRLEHFQTEIRFDISCLLPREVFEPFLLLGVSFGIICCSISLPSREFPCGPSVSSDIQVRALFLFPRFVLAFLRFLHLYPLSAANFKLKSSSKLIPRGAL